MNKFTLVVLLGTALSMKACSSSSSSPFAPDGHGDWASSDDVSTSSLRKEIETRQSARRGRSPLETPEHADVDDYVRLALDQNPAIRSAKQRVLRLTNRIPQATSLPDPMLQVTPIGEMAETAAGQVNLMAGISQRIPLPKKRETRGRVAAQDVAEAIQQLEEVRLNVEADTRVAWWSHYFAIQAIEVTDRNRSLVAQFKDVADAKFRAGAAAQEDVLRASVELSSLENELVSLNQLKVSAEAMLNRLIDRPVTSAIPEPDDQTIEAIDFQLASLLTKAEAAHPSLQRQRERIEGFKQRYELAMLDRWPDLTLSFAYNLVENDGLSPVANGDDQWWIGFGITLPIWTDRLESAEREALRGRLENIELLNSERNRIEFLIQDTLTKTLTHRKQALMFRDVIIPQAKQTLDASLSSYRAGNVEFLTLIDNWRKLLAFELTFHHHLSQFKKSMAELRRAAGIGMEDTNEKVEPDQGAEVQS
ncbi:MAG: TolC family protein [Planctomycetota bacterium]|nr:TolC family protein [Planctomycetota bacterium]